MPTAGMPRDEQNYGKSPFFMGKLTINGGLMVLTSGKQTKSELENGPVEIVDLPIENSDVP